MAKGIVFDLDGTLVDTAPDLCAVAAKVLADHGLPPVPVETFVTFVGNGIPKQVERSFRFAGKPLSGAEFDHAVHAFHDYAAQEPVKHSKLYPGVLDMLDSLKADGFVLGICTNKTEDLARHVVGHMGLSEYFASLVGGDTTPKLKPAPEPLLKCASDMGCEISDIIYIGDSEADASTATATKVPFMLFTKGYRKTPVSELAHDIAFDDFSTLPGHIKDIAGA
jgi:phosphoglycolate phosphatase